MYVGRIERLLAHYSPLPMCIINAQGKVTRASSKIDEVFKYDGIVDGDIFALTGIKLCEITKAASEGTALYLKRNDKSFKVLADSIGGDDVSSIMLHFIDMTAYDNLKDLYNNDKLCIALVNVDNFDELTSSAGEDREMKLSGEIDRLIRDWAHSMEAGVSRYRDHLYEIVLTNKNYKWLVSNKFSILDEAREIETEADFPVTLSIGIGLYGKTPAESEAYAQDALDLALGRGGDQAVVKNVKNFEYYGGKTHSVEKSNKGKSRIIAHALKLLMSQASKVFIMGHKNPDMDCFGASLGIHRLAASIGKETYIVIDSYNDALTSIYEDAKDSGEYDFISSERSLSLLDGNSMVVVLDTHRPVLAACLELVERAEKTVVIDHHRKAEDAFTGTILSYMESYASSTSELVTEVIQYACEKKALSKMEADALLAGIMVDTNRFAVKAGVRTFEAASWLRRNGADLEKVRRYFQADSNSFKMRANCIANAGFYEGGIAMSICTGLNPNSQIINSQVADELLTIKGIKASFVAGQNECGRTVVSARSLGDINVQLIMEKFGGGGHFNTAGAQSDLSPEDILKQISLELHTRRIKS
ncbi:MAG: DHH family phosphoesterase [Clostridiales bacterium]|nr:DHH family phosphoesterase [Clostridiales bacterium]